MPGKQRWVLALTSIAALLIMLDALVVTTALPTIRRELDASLAELEWTINAYTLSFAVLLMAGAALGDRYGRRRVLTLGLALFTLGGDAGCGGHALFSIRRRTASERAWFVRCDHRSGYAQWPSARWRGDRTGIAGCARLVRKSGVDDHVKLAGAVDAFDAVEFDVAGGAGAADPGLRS